MRYLSQVYLSFAVLFGMGPVSMTGISAPVPQRAVTGSYKGICQGRVVTIKLTPGTDVNSQSAGVLVFGEDHYPVECYTTSDVSKCRLRVLRTSNPAILGEYLSWVGVIEYVDYETIELTVVNDLSLIEKVKYNLPSQGVSCTLKLQGNKGSTTHPIAKTGFLRGVQLFSGSVSINDQTLPVTFKLDFSSNSGSCVYSASPLPLTISKMQKTQNTATYTLTERNPNRTSIPDNYLGGNVTAIYHCTHLSDDTITGWGQNFKGQTFRFSLKKSH